MIRIRHAIAQDQDRITQLQQTSQPDGDNAVLPMEAAENRQPSCRELLMVAEQAGELLGFIRVHYAEDVLIDNLQVLPDYRSRGIGENLLGVASTSLLVRGYRDASVWLYESNLNALRFLQRRGASIVDRRRVAVPGKEVLKLRLYWSDLGDVLKAVGQQEKKQWMNRPTYNA